MHKTLLVAIALSLIVAACGSPSGSSDDVAPSTEPAADLSPVDQAVADLTARLGDNATIEVVFVEDVTWRDGSLGCPQPGMSYTQALVDGYRIELTDGDTAYFYHGAVGRSPFLCENQENPTSLGSRDLMPQVTIPTATFSVEGETSVVDEDPTLEPGDTDSGATDVQPLLDTSGDPYDGPLKDLVALAAADLVKQRSVAVSGVIVVSAESVVWPDGSLGCPIPGMRYTQVQIDGAKIVLSVEGTLYEYHSGSNRDPFMCAPTATITPDSKTKLTLPATTGPIDE